MRGIILEVQKRSVIVLTPDNEYIKIRKENRIYDIGEELQFTLSGWNIVLSEWKNRLLSYIQIRNPIVAGVGLCVILLSMVPLVRHQSPYGSERQLNQPIAAYVSVDINPSVEVGVDSLLRVENVQSFNQDGGHVLSQITDWKGQSLEDVLYSIIKTSDQDGFLKGDRHVLISSNVVQLDGKYQALLNQAIDRISKTEETGQNVTVHVLQGSSSTHKTSEALGMSEGKYLWYESVKQQGINMTLEHVKDTSVSDLDKEVTESISKEVGKSGNSKGTDQIAGIDKVTHKNVAIDNKPDKVDAEKSTMNQSNIYEESNKKNTGNSSVPVNTPNGETIDKHQPNHDADHDEEHKKELNARYGEGDENTHNTHGDH